MVDEQIKEFQNYLKSKGRSLATIKIYSFVLDKFFKQYTNKQPEQITNKDIDDFVMWVSNQEEKRHTLQQKGRGFGRLAENKGQPKPSTINIYLSALKKFFTYNGQTELSEKIEYAKIAHWQPQLIDLQIIKELFKDGEMETLRNAITESIRKRRTEENATDPIDEFYIDRNAMIFYVIFNLGIRVGEASNLTKNDFKFNLTKPIVIVNGKTGQRTLQMGESMVKIVQEYIEKYNIQEHLFSNKTGGALGVNTIKNYIWETFHYGLGYKYHAHTLRHAFATFLLDGGRPIKEIQNALGHGSIDVTARYLDLIEGQNPKPLNPADELMKKGDEENAKN